MSETTEKTLCEVKKLLDEINSIVDQINVLKVERDQLQPLPGSLRRRLIRCGKCNCRCRQGQLHGPYYYFEPSKCRGKWQYITREELARVEQGVADWKKQLEIDEEIKALSSRIEEIRLEMTALIPNY
jgi:uncharacterized coiled-coil DUF342 family protein